MKTYFICSSGGHLTELIYSVGADVFKLNPTLLTYEDMNVNGVTYFKLINPHRSLFKYFLCFVQTFKYFLKRPPDVIFSTGAGIAIPGIILGKLFFKSDIVFIESLAYINRPTITGRLAYYFSDLFIVQNKELLKIYPNARLGRLI